MANRGGAVVKVGTAMVTGKGGGNKQRCRKKMQKKRDCGVVEMHCVIKSRSCNGQRDRRKGERGERGKAGGDTEVVWKLCRGQVKCQ